MIPEKYESYLEPYAELIVKVGLNLQPGQNLIINGKSPSAAPLVRAVTKSAYQNQCRVVKVVWVDSELVKIRCQYADPDSLTEFNFPQIQAIIDCIEQDYVYLVIQGNDPEIFNDVEPDAIGIVNKSLYQNALPIQKHIGKGNIQWAIANLPTVNWSKRVFPEDDHPTSLDKLWKAVIKVCRFDEEDLIGFWRDYLDRLSAYAAYLNEKKYQTIILKGPGTDLEVGLPKDHIWLAARLESQDGVPYSANLPTEEVFTINHRDQVNGYVKSTRPLNYSGMHINEFSLTFKDGVVQDVSAETGEDLLKKLLSFDKNANRLGEIALVSHQTPISKSGIIFKEIMYDENASSHLALGNAYRFNIEGGRELSDEEFEKAGGNNSNIHADFMIGSGEMDVDGVFADGNVEPIMRAGEWAIEV
jgi:aminopeptidase